jgi:hypothetical protein
LPVFGPGLRISVASAIDSCCVRPTGAFSMPSLSDCAIRSIS